MIVVSFMLISLPADLGIRRCRAALVQVRSALAGHDKPHGQPDQPGDGQRRDQPGQEVQRCPRV
jgi:hypothetical protein